MEDSFGEVNIDKVKFFQVTEKEVVAAGDIHEAETYFMSLFNMNRDEAFYYFQSKELSFNHVLLDSGRSKVTLGEIAQSHWEGPPLLILLEQ
ncbi:MULTISPECIES: hypothetical protein [unclassified Bacillus (in: firmicutes)]|uniref:hypothetical protein n=1 Tax=unclassified Bacillus (in: firmicutes) TaxID=185979 RepID=UPI001BE6A0DC|nr:MULTISPECIES: hypothetical protein [unclassified Bacillus (in: firmicutes)]MBT2618981.1 hypothetical protein [Bacillus sp. ISL-78]MBT2630643.1 hypothetical protein [Bacillus sp. ISL-101]